MVEFVCKCGGTIEENSLSEEWIQDGENISNDGFVCRDCGKEFVVTYSFVRLECRNCKQDIEYCECKEDDDDM